MRALHHLAFLLEETQAPSPGQQLLDRFALGYPRDGTVHHPALDQLTAYQMLTADDGEWKRRAQESDVTPASTAEQAVEEADAVIVASRKPGAVANERLVRIALERAPAGGACFVHGALANSLTEARALVDLSRRRQIALLAGSALALTWRLPELPLPIDRPLREALIIVQGAFPGGEFQALEGLLPIVERRAGGESGVRRLRYLSGRDVWRAGQAKEWSNDLLAAALSRSDSPQGDPVLDGRTQDLFGLGLVPRLAKAPRGWILDHADGLRSTLLVLDGVVADFNFAVREADGTVHSAQLFRAPPPAEQHYSRLVEVIETFFRSGTPPWAVERSVLIAGLLEQMGLPSSRSRAATATPGLLRTGR